MSDPNSDGGPLGRLVRAERRLYERAPIDAYYSMLLVRSIAWFLFFGAVYTVVTAVL